MFEPKRDYASRETISTIHYIRRASLFIQLDEINQIRVGCTLDAGDTKYILRTKFWWETS
jgi:hypothetical protein